MPSYLITGVNRGIGYGWIKYLTQQSSSNIVIGTVRNKSDPAFTSLLAGDGLSEAPNLHIFEADVTDVASLNRIEPEIASITNGSLDVIVNNAGYIARDTQLIQPSQFTNGKEGLLKSEIDAAINVNVIGCAYVTNVFLPLLRKEEGSRKKLVFVSSANGDARHPDGFTFQKGIAPAVPYSVSKAAVNMLAAKYAVELKDEGIVVLSISPGLVNNTGTPKTSEENAKLAEKFGPESVDGRFKGWLEPVDSVKLQLEVIEKATIEDSGRFLSHYGDDCWW